jgi:tRNA pseudouridine13 synthase
MLTLTKSRGTGGVIKSEPADFIVKEITGGGVSLSPDVQYTAISAGDSEDVVGKFTTFVLQKENWNTVQAVISVAKRLGRGKKAVSYAGTKDRRAITVQLASIYGVGPERVARVRIKDIKINGAWKSNGVELGSNEGNSFEIVVREAGDVGDAMATIDELHGRMPNYFDRQRFGDRLGNAAVGLDIMRGDFEGAAMRILTDTTGERNAEATAARDRLREERDFRAALEYFPRYLKPERSMLENLARYGNYANAIRVLPRGISIMFIHAVESLVFNMSLEQRIGSGDFESVLYCREGRLGFPEGESVTAEKTPHPAAALIGYETKEEHVDERSAAAMERIGITRDSFRIKGMPELSMRGAYRAMLAPVKGLSAGTVGEGTIKLAFSIPSGSYATVLVNEITKADNLDLGALWHARQDS